MSIAALMGGGQDLKMRLFLDDQFTSTLQKAGGKTKRFKQQQKSAWASIGTYIKGAGLMIALYWGKELATYLVATTNEVEQLQLRLVGLKGGTEEAAEAFDYFRQVASRVPYDLGAVANAGVTIEAFGARAEQALVPVTDLAAFMGTDLVAASEAFGRAWAGGAGSARVLRKRGILNIIALQTGIQDLTKLDLPEFRRVLLESLTDHDGKIAGSAARLTETLSGKWSMLTDKTYILASALGESGLSGALGTVIGGLEGAVAGAASWMSALNRIHGSIDKLGLQEKIIALKESLPEQEEILTRLGKGIRVAEEVMAETSERNQQTAYRRAEKLWKKRKVRYDKTLAHIQKVNREIDALEQRGRAGMRSRVDKTLHDRGSGGREEQRIKDENKAKADKKATEDKEKTLQRRLESEADDMTRLENQVSKWQEGQREKKIERQNTLAEELRVWGLTKLEILEEDLNKELLILEDNEDAKFQAVARYRKKVAKLEEKETKTRLKLKEKENQAMWNTQVGLMNSLTGAMSAWGAKTFYLEQGVAIGKAIMNTNLAATKTLAMFPGPLGIKMAKLTKISGMLNVATIVAQTISGSGGGGSSGGGGGYSGGGGSGGGTTEPPQIEQARDTTQAFRHITIEAHFHDPILSDEYVDDAVIPRLQARIRDGLKIDG